MTTLHLLSGAPDAARSSAALAGRLSGLYAQHLAAHPDDAYLAQHADARTVADHVRTFAWYRPLLPDRGTVLDWGCNHAPDSCLLRAACGDALELHGCDFRPDEQYRCFHEFAGLAYTPLVDTVGLPYGANTFDVVIGSGTLEHVAMDYESLKELYRVLKLDGLLILTYLPNHWSFREWLRRVRGQDHHRRRYGLNEAKRLLQRCGLGPICARRQCFGLERFVGAQVISSTFCLAARKVHSM